MTTFLVCGFPPLIALVFLFIFFGALRIDRISSHARGGRRTAYVLLPMSYLSLHESPKISPEKNRYENA